MVQKDGLGINLSRNMSNRMISKTEMDEQQVENSSDPKFVPYSRNSKELKLLYSEQKDQSYKSIKF